MASRAIGQFSVGIILDSSELIAAERTGMTVRETLFEIRKSVDPQEVAISVISLVELSHGIARADTVHRKASRAQFLAEVRIVFVTYPVSSSIAVRAGRIDGENRAKGIQLSLADLLIGVTALDLGYAIVTRNSRHFRMIPELKVISV